MPTPWEPSTSGASRSKCLCEFGLAADRLRSPGLGRFRCRSSRRTARSLQWHASAGPLRSCDPYQLDHLGNCIGFVAQRGDRGTRVGACQWIAATQLPTPARRRLPWDCSGGQRSALRKSEDRGHRNSRSSNLSTATHRRPAALPFDLPSARKRGRRKGDLGARAAMREEPQGFLAGQPVLLLMKYSATNGFGGDHPPQAGPGMIARDARAVGASPHGKPSVWGRALAMILFS
jgi:hypothetical protein